MKNQGRSVMLKQVGRRMLMGMLVGVALSVSGGEAVGATDKAPTSQAETPKGPRAIIKTKFGDIEMKFYPDVAPKHVENFIKLAKSGFYNGTIFHRVIPGFMIQGGDPNTKDSLKKDIYGQGGPGHTVKAEFGGNNPIPHKRGIVSMARAADPDSAGSQFFIVVEDSRFLDGKYSVFGEVTRGIGVADKIVNLARDERDNPKERVEMTVTIVE
jgi:peptidyl-prolyl cis-trans isomerase B (cyclophilin B)